MPRTHMRFAPLFVLFAISSGCRSAPQTTPQPSSSMAPVPSPAAQPRALVAVPQAPSISASSGLASPRHPGPTARPQTKQACDGCLGQWAVHGIAETESCICKTKDGGRACRDGADCEGQCLVAEDAKFVVMSPGPPPRGYYVGRCSEFDTTFGCNRMIPHGVRAQGPLPSSDAVTNLCMD